VPPAPPPPPPPSFEPYLARGLLLLALVLGAILRVRLALTDDGLYWPDEIYQSLEPAHRLVFGYGLVAWEFIDGARNWALPGLVAGLMEVARGLGLDTPGGYLGVVKGFFALLGTACAWGSYRLARTYGATPLAAAAGACLLALGAVPIYFAPRAMSENASALPVVWGLAIALTPNASRRALGVGASLLGLAVMLRLQNGVFCVGLLAILAARRQWKEARLTLGVLAVWAVLFGLLDRLTWGDWFHSARVYLEFNLIKQGGSGWGTAPFSYYSRALLKSMAGISLVSALLTLLALRRARGLAALVIAFYLLHAAQPHKELRFLIPMFPLFAALAGIGLDVVLSDWKTDRVRAVLALGVAAVGLVSAALSGGLTFGELGQYESTRPQVSAYDDSGAINRLLAVAGQRQDVCGLKIEAPVHLAWTGGYSYFHKLVPLYWGQGPDRGSGLFNYVITLPQLGFGGEEVARDQDFVLLRLRLPGCAADPGYSWRLP
jgi:phosphatidylinositol glycan class B